MRPIDLKGKRFGMWTVIEKADRPPTNSPSKPMYWKCKCDCGNERIIPAHNLRCKRTGGCGHDLELPDYNGLYKTLLKCNTKTEPPMAFEEFLTFVSIKICHYCHAPIIWSQKGRMAYNIDRMDNHKGYTKSNCVVCCKRCNFSKANRFSYAEWYEMTKCFRQTDKNFTERMV